MIKLSVLDTFLSAVPLLIAIALYYNHLKRSLDLTIACARMVLQLLTIGYLLTFVFSYEWPWLGLVILLFMTTIASTIVMRPLQEKSWVNFRHILCSLLCSGGFHLLWIIIFVLHLKPWYQPEVVIPLAGMIFANCMNSLSLGAERLESEAGKPNAKITAFNAAMIPQLNSLLAVGLVALPGMMTGQILSGVSPLEAVRYQIMIMSTVVGTSAMGLTIYFALNQKTSKTRLKDKT